MIVLDRLREKEQILSFMLDEFPLSLGALGRLGHMIVALPYLVIKILIVLLAFQCGLQYEYEPRHEKTGFLHMRKQRRRSASW